MTGSLTAPSFIANNIDCTVDSQGGGWIRYSNGLQICWGWQLATTTTNSSIIFPKAFIRDAFHQVTTSNIRNFIIPDSVVSIGGNLFRNYVFDTITICCSNMHNLQSKNAIGAKNVLILNYLLLR